MAKSKRVMRRTILIRLFEHLKEVYDIETGRESFVDGSLGLRQIDAVLAFKSDPLIEEFRSALERLEAGNYGRCTTCKAPIAQAVLDEDPARRFCDRCEHSLVFTEPSRFPHAVQPA